MNCAFDKEKLTGYYDGELDAAEKAEVERHIASCSECLRELGELKSAAILVKELPRLRAPRSVAEGVSREVQSAGKVHSFAKMRRTVLWASAAAAALFIGLNIMYFGGGSEKSPSADLAKAEERPTTTTAPMTLGKVQQAPQADEASKAGEKDAVARRGAADRALDEGRSELRKALEEQKQAHDRDDAAKKPDAPAERARENKDKADGLAKAAPGAARPATEPAAPAKPAAAPPAPLAPPAAKSPVPPPAPPAELAEKAATRKDENLPRAEAEAKGAKRSLALDPAADAPTHLTLAATQIVKARPQLDEALRKIGVAPPAPAATKMKAARDTETTIALELTDSQIARLRQELDKPGASKLINAAPGDPVLAQFRDGRMFAGKKENGATVAGGAAAPTARKEAPKTEPKPEAKDAKEFFDLKKSAEGAPADKAPEPRRKIVLHLLEVPFVPDERPASDALKK